VPDPNLTSAILLAAGVSSRMGGPNKLLLPYDGRPVVVASLDALRVFRWLELIAVTGSQRHLMVETLRYAGARLCHNDRFRDGMGVSLASGVAAASPRAAGFLIALADMPALRSETVGLLRKTFSRTGDRAIVAPVHDGRRGHPVLFAGVYRGELAALEGDSGARQVIRRHGDCLVEVAVQDPGVLRDLDTPAAYRRMRKDAD